MAASLSAKGEKIAESKLNYEVNLIRLKKEMSSMQNISRQLSK